DGREGHGGGRGEVDVVVAHDGEVGRDGDAQCGAAAQEAKGEQVVGAERGGRAGGGRQAGQALARVAAVLDGELRGGEVDQVVGAQAGREQGPQRALPAVADLAEGERAADEG